MKEIIWCTKQEFHEIKFYYRFHVLIILARFINALRFCQKSILELDDNSNQCSNGTRLNSLLCASSVLYEGLNLIDKLREDKNINNLNSFKKEFEPLINDPLIEDLRESILTKIRNKFVFHFDRGAVKKSLKTFNPINIIFASRAENCTGGTYFALADDIVMNYLLEPGQNESNESLTDRFDKIIKDTCLIMNKFNKGAIRLMAELMEDMPFKKSSENSLNFEP